MQKSARLRIDDQLCFALYAATHAITRAYRPLLADLDLTYPQYLVLLVLWQDGARSIHEIAERLHLGPSAVTPLVDRLEKAGFVARQRGNRDRRLVRVVLTGAGARLERSAARVQETVACRTGLVPADLDALRTDLHELVAGIAADLDAAAKEFPRAARPVARRCARA